MNHQLRTHLRFDVDPRSVQQDGRIILHQRCIRCLRDFSQGFSGLYDWRAVYVGVFRIEALVNTANSRWLAEACPGKVLESDDIDRTMRWHSAAAWRSELS